MVKREPQALPLRVLCLTLCAAAMMYLFMASGLGLNLFEHSAHDSYTLQAMRWRQGSIALDQNYEHLELAIYKGEYYVSFPPFPTVPMLLLTFLFGENTPSMLVNFLLFLGSTYFAFRIAHALGLRDEEAGFYSLFWTAGGNLLEISLYGGVWNLAQGMSFFLTMVCVYGLVQMDRDEKWRYIAPIALACAVGCRPFQAVYVPLVLHALFRTQEDKAGMGKRIRRCVSYIIVPGLIACAYGAYNLVRFGNVFEFGHNYLPEFMQARYGQFSLHHVAKNWSNINRLPAFEENFRLVFPGGYGFAFYIANPLFLLAGMRLVEAIYQTIRGRKRALDATDGLLLAGVAIHFFLLLLHRTFGGWQFGTRYLVDLLPMLGLFTLRRNKALRLHEGIVMLFAIGFNVYGTMTFHLLYLL